MGLSTDLSIVADSELASSPTPSMQSPPAPIRRAARTYGRRRDDQDTSINSEQNSIYRTGPPDLLDEVPASELSRVPGSDDDDDDDENTADEVLARPAMTKYQFGAWKMKLEKIDNAENPSEFVDTYTDNRTGNDIQSRGDTDTDIDTPAKPTSNVFLSSPSGNISSCSQPPLTSEASTSQSRPSPSHHHSRNRLRTQRNLILSDDEKDDHPTSPVSPSLHLIGTPRSLLGSSPPTSNHDINSTSSSVSKNKGKSKSTTKTRPSVVPLHFDKHRLESFADLNNTTRRSAQSYNEKKSKVKAPTKKELQETYKTRARLAQEESVTIARVEGEGRSMSNFLAGISQRKANVTPSSPIDDFSSSQPNAKEPSRSTVISKASSSERSGVADVFGPVQITPLKPKPKQQPNDELEANKQRLAFIKKKLVEQGPQPSFSDDDDDLEVVGPTGLDIQRMSSQKKKRSKAQKQFLANAKIKVAPLHLHSRSAHKEEGESAVDDLDILKDGTSDIRLLQRAVKRQADKESSRVVKEKELAFINHGGKLTKPEDELTVAGTKSILELASKGAEIWANSKKRSGATMDNDIEEEDDDSDYTPEERGSASPAQKSEEEEQDDIDYEKLELGEDEAMSTDEQEADDEDKREPKTDDENENIPACKAKVKRRRQTGRIVDSDDSDSGEYEVENTGFKKQTIDYGAFSSDDRTEDENDKENDTRLMFDISEDKENKAVVRHEPLSSGRPLRSIFDDTSDFDRDLSLSPPHVMSLELSQDAGASSSTPGTRKPLGVLGESPGFQRTTTLTQMFVAQSKLSSPTRPVADGDVFGPVQPVSSNLSFAPVFRGDANQKGKAVSNGFSQFSQEGSSMSFGGPALLKPGFGDLFDSETQKEGTPLKGLRKESILGLTQDLVLQPAFQVDEDRLKKADAIFEKEQEFVVEAAVTVSPKGKGLYVNDVGFLTQTRPSAVGARSPSLMFSPSQMRSQSPGGLTQTQRRASISTTPRPPLRTISLHNPPPTSSPETSPKLHRLRKRGATPTARTPRDSPRISSASVTPVGSPIRPRNAFDLLGKKPVEKNKGKEKESKVFKMIKGVYLADEAEESDEDNLVGFGLTKKGGDDDEEEGVDLDATLTELVDDNKMDEETEAAEKVQEKHRELLEIDDEAELKFAEGVVQGELRKKKRGKFGIDDSDDEDDDDDSGRRARRKMYKKQRVERGDIQTLAANEKTAAFAQAYQSSVVDDESIDLRPFDMSTAFQVEREGEDKDDTMGDDEDDDQGEDGKEKKENEVLSYTQFREEVRYMAEHPEEQEPEIDVEDVSWIDADEDMDMDVDIKMVTAQHPKKNAVSATVKSVADTDFMMFKPIRRQENLKDLERSKAWARTESRNISGSTGRTVGGSAVTGHGINKLKSGGGSLRAKALTSLAAASGSSISTNIGKKPLKAQGSILSNISKKQDHFQ